MYKACLWLCNSKMKKILTCLVTNKRYRRYQRLFLVIFFVTMILFIRYNWIIQEYHISPLNQPQMYVPTDHFKTTLPGYFKRTKPKILLWTPFFGEMKWYEESKNIFSEYCHSDCALTNNRSEIQTADAVIFHLHDITWDGSYRTILFRYPMPKYRRPDQVWILFNLEPVSIVLGRFTDWQGIFNWTWSYPRDSDVFAPYGRMRRLTAEEITELKSPDNIRSALSYDYFGEKNKSHGVTMISNCDDQARRYKIIENLRKHINIDVYGRCGRPCPGDFASCLDLLKPYKFYFAFENTDCRDYVTEKYWRVLKRGQIPVVAWKYSMEDLVIPGSYINVYDFKDLDSAGKHIKKVSENRTLYNSYFKWKTKYAPDYQNPFCTICEKLKNSSLSSQVYHNMYGWLTNSYCPQATIFMRLRRIVDRFLFDGRLPLP